MKQDMSFVLYEKYFSLENGIIEVELKDNTIFIGKFIGFSHGDLNFNEMYIKEWQLVDEDCALGFDAFGDLNGQIIKQNEILKIKFYEDNSVMVF